MSRAGRDYEIEAVVAAPFEQIAYVAWRVGRDEAVVVDPGFDAAGIRSLLERHGLRPVAILITHGHADHIAGNKEMKAAYPDATLIIGQNEAEMLTDAEANLSAGFGFPFTSPPADRMVAEDERLDLAGFTFEVREIPGHSPGSVIYLSADTDPPFAFVGDVLFAGAIGRFDLPGSSGSKLVSGIRAKLLTLPEETAVYAGHGPATTIGREKRTNPFVGDQAGSYRLD